MIWGIPDPERDITALLIYFFYSPIPLLILLMQFLMSRTMNMMIKYFIKAYYEDLQAKASTDMAMSLTRVVRDIFPKANTIDPIIQGSNTTLHISTLYDSNLPFSVEFGRHWND